MQIEYFIATKVLGYFSATKILKHLFWEMYSISLNISTLDAHKNFLIHKNELTKMHRKTKKYLRLRQAFSSLHSR